MERMLTKITAILILLISSVACSDAGGTAFVGKWMDVSQWKNNALEITPNGHLFVVRTLATGMGAGNPPLEKKFSAAIRDGMLVVDYGGISQNASIEQTTGHLLLGGHQYRRLSPGEPFEVQKPGSYNPFSGSVPKK
jgi:hypothetical protein